MSQEDRIKQAIEQLDANIEAFSVEEVNMLRSMLVDYLEQIESGTNRLPAGHVLLMNEILRNEDGFKAACKGLLRFMSNCIEVACTKTNPDFTAKIRESYYGWQAEFTKGLTEDLIDKEHWMEWKRKG